MGAQGIAALGKVSLGDGAVIVGRRGNRQGINTSGLQPLLCPEGEIAPGCLFEVAEQIIEGGVTPRVGGEVAGTIPPAPWLRNRRGCGLI